MDGTPCFYWRGGLILDGALYYSSSKWLPTSGFFFGGGGLMLDALLGVVGRGTPGKKTVTHFEDPLFETALLVSWRFGLGRWLFSICRKPRDQS